MAATSADMKMPKRAPSGYWIWLGENRAEVVKALGGNAKGSDVAKKAGEMWKAMSAEQQAPFLQKSEEAKKALEASRPKQDNMATGTVEEDIRKKPMTPVFAYIQEKREEIAALPGVNGLGQISKKGAELYKALPEAEKSQRQQRYEEELKSYQEWAASDEGKNALVGKRTAAAEKRAAKKEKVAKKESKLARKEGKGVKESEGVKVPTTKRERGHSSAPQTEEVPIDAKVLVEAQKLGLENSLKNLANRPEIASSGKSSKDIFDALKSSNGLVNPAKRALLGA